MAGACSWTGATCWGDTEEAGREAADVVILLHRKDLVGEDLKDFSGLAFRSPFAAFSMLLFMLSLGGIPPTFGFFGKYVVFMNAVQDGRWGLAIVGVLASLVGVFYYLRIVYTLYMKPESRLAAEGSGLLIDGWGRAAAVLAAIGILVLGVWPTRLLEWVLGSPWAP